jgi:hypothetical protein
LDERNARMHNIASLQGGNSFKEIEITPKALSAEQEVISRITLPGAHQLTVLFGVRYN